MIRTLIVAIFCGSFILTSGVVQAEVVLDFETLAHNDANFELEGSQINDQGFILNESSGVGFGTAGTMESRFSGSTALAAASTNSLIALTRDGGGTFGINSIDLAEFSGGAATITFTGILEFGGTTSQTFTLDGNAFAAETFNFDSSFDSVLAVVWVQGATSHQFDNISLTVVPEPVSAVAISVLGLAAISRRRR